MQAVDPEHFGGLALKPAALAPLGVGQQQAKQTERPGKGAEQEVVAGERHCGEVLQRPGFTAIERHARQQQLPAGAGIGLPLTLAQQGPERHKQQGEEGAVTGE